MRALARCAVVIGAGLAACSEPNLDSPGVGGLALRVLASSGGMNHLDSGHVVITGPTNRTVRVTPGQTVTVDGLLPGSYTVLLRGFAGGGIDHFGGTTATVAIGQNTPASLTFASFVPTLPVLPNFISTTFPVVFRSVPGAASYEVESATNAAFTANRVAVTTTDTTTPITAGEFGRHLVRVRAIDAQGGRGRPTANRDTYLAQLDQQHVPASFTLFAGGNTHKAMTFTVGQTGTLTQIDIYIAFAATDMLFDVRATTGGAPNESDAVTLYDEVIPATRITTAGYYSFPLGANGIAVTAGQVLAFVMRPTTGLSFQWNGTNTNAYAGGVWYFRNPSGGVNTWTISNATFDMAFRTYVSP